MTLETYLAIALLNMGKDAMNTYEAKIHYSAAASLFWSLIWPLSAAIMIIGVIYRQRKPNSVNHMTSGAAQSPQDEKGT